MAQVLTNIFRSVNSSVKLVLTEDTIISDSKVQVEERIITLQEVSWHDTRDDCWVVIYDRVYDITDFLEEHPGGSDILLEHAGRDGSIAFRGSGHSDFALRSLHKYFIGELPEKERIFRKPGGLRFSGIPE